MPTIPQIHKYKNGVFIEKYPKNPYHGFCKAAKAGNINLIEYYINNGVDNMAAGSQYAAEGGHKILVDYFNQKLIEKGVKLDWNSVSDGAIEGNHLDLVKYAVENNNNNLIQNDYGRMLRAAADLGHGEICQWIIENFHNDMPEWNIDMQNRPMNDLQKYYKNKWYAYALSAAVENNHHEVAEIIFNNIDGYFDIDSELKDNCKNKKYVKFLNRKK